MISCTCRPEYVDKPNILELQPNWVLVSVVGSLISESFER